MDHCFQSVKDIKFESNSQPFWVMHTYAPLSLMLLIYINSSFFLFCTTQSPALNLDDFSPIRTKASIIACDVDDVLVLLSFLSSFPEQMICFISLISFVAPHILKNRIILRTQYIRDCRLITSL